MFRYIFLMIFLLCISWSPTQAARLSSAPRSARPSFGNLYVYLGFGTPIFRRISNLHRAEFSDNIREELTKGCGASGCNADSFLGFAYLSAALGYRTVSRTLRHELGFIYQSNSADTSKLLRINNFNIDKEQYNNIMFRHQSFSLIYSLYFHSSSSSSFGNLFFGIGLGAAYRRLGIDATLVPKKDASATTPAVQQDPPASTASVLSVTIDGSSSAPAAATDTNDNKGAFNTPYRLRAVAQVSIGSLIHISDGIAAQLKLSYSVSGIPKQFWSDSQRIDHMVSVEFGLMFDC